MTAHNGEVVLYDDRGVTAANEPSPEDQLALMNRTNSSVQLKVNHLTPNAIRRGREAREFHFKMGHPCDATLGGGLDGGCYAGTDLTSADLKVANMVLGPFEACIEGKMTAPSEPSSKSWHDTGVGHTMYYDLYPLKHETIGGNKWVLFGTESSCGFMTIDFSKRKTTELCYKMLSESVAELK